MNGLNRVMLLGNLGLEPELRYTEAGRAVLNLRLATKESWFDKHANERKERTDWHNVVVWGPRAEGLAKILKKGASVFAEGRLQTTQFTDRDGNPRWRTDIVASNIILSGRTGSDFNCPNGVARPATRPGPRAPAPLPVAPVPRDEGPQPWDGSDPF